MNRDEALALLESLKIDHYTETEGLASCMAVAPQGEYNTCDCGANEHNANVDRLLEYLESQFELEIPDGYEPIEYPQQSGCWLDDQVNVREYRAQVRIILRRMEI